MKKVACIQNKIDYGVRHNRFADEDQDQGEWKLAVEGRLLVSCNWKESLKDGGSSSRQVEKRRMIWMGPGWIGMMQPWIAHASAPARRQSRRTTPQERRTTYVVGDVASIW